MFGRHSPFYLVLTLGGDVPGRKLGRRYKAAFVSEMKP